jgi:peptidoglycan L-alanyl-D-glutamate endopeptidase CwlK
VSNLKGSNILGTASLGRFNTLHPALKVLVLTILDRIDVTVVTGNRGEDEQNKAFADGKSSLRFPQSKHNKTPSLAVDIAPYIRGKGVRWNSNEVSLMQGRIAEIACFLGIPIRWGGDWDGDGDITEHKLQDFVHIELVESKLKQTTWRYL